MNWPLLEIDGLSSSEVRAYHDHLIDEFNTLNSRFRELSAAGEHLRAARLAKRLRILSFALDRIELRGWELS